MNDERNSGSGMATVVSNGFSEKVKQIILGSKIVELLEAEARNEQSGN